MTFEEWKLTQEEDLGWNKKFNDKTRNADWNGQVNLLTFEEYLYKAYQAGLLSSDDIGKAGYHLSRIGDIGDYTVESCRFLPCRENLKEKNTLSIQGENHPNAKLTNSQVVEIWYDNRNYKDIAESYNIRGNVVYEIKTKRRWSSITNNLPLDMKELKS